MAFGRDNSEVLRCGTCDVCTWVGWAPGVRGDERKDCGCEVGDCERDTEEKVAVVLMMR